MSQYWDSYKNIFDTITRISEQIDALFPPSLHEQIQSITQLYSEIAPGVLDSLSKISDISNALSDALNLSVLSDTFELSSFSDSLISAFSNFNFSTIIKSATENNGVVELCDNDFDALSSLEQTVSPALAQNNVLPSVEKKMSLPDICLIIQTIVAVLSLIWMINQDRGETDFQQKQLAIQQEELAIQQQQVNADEAKNDELDELNEFLVECLNRLETLSAPEDTDSHDSGLPTDPSSSQAESPEQSSTGSEVQDLSGNSDG